MANAPWIEPVAALGGQIMQTLERTATALERIATALEQKRDLSSWASTDKFVAALDAKLGAASGRLDVLHLLLPADDEAREDMSSPTSGYPHHNVPMPARSLGDSLNPVFFFEGMEASGEVVFRRWVEYTELVRKRMQQLFDEYPAVMVIAIGIQWTDDAPRWRMVEVHRHA